MVQNIFKTRPSFFPYNSLSMNILHTPPCTNFNFFFTKINAPLNAIFSQSCSSPTLGTGSTSCLRRLYETVDSPIGPRMTDAPHVTTSCQESWARGWGMPRLVSWTAWRSGWHEPHFACPGVNIGPETPGRNAALLCFGDDRRVYTDTCDAACWPTTPQTLPAFPGRQLIQASWSVTLVSECYLPKLNNAVSCSNH